MLEEPGRQEVNLNCFMKRCPQCNNLYPEETLYCLGDGQVLISERLPLPSELSVDNDEEATIIRHEPIVVDLSAAKEPKTEVLPQQQRTPYQIPPSAVVVERIPVRTKSNFGKYLVFLITGLLLGGGLVLATLFLTGRNYNRQNNAANAGTASNANSNQTRASNGEPKNSASPAKTPLPINPEHQQRTDVSDDEFNGRVITSNAYVRS